MILFSALFFASMSTMVSVAQEVPPMQKVFFRNLFAIPVSLVIVRVSGSVKTLVPEKASTRFDLAARAVVGTFAMVLHFTALSNLVAADAVILNRLAPFFMIVFSALLMGEKISPKGAWVFFFAFVGVLLVVKPGFSDENMWMMLVGLSGGVLAGLAQTFVRRLGLANVPVAVPVFWFSVISVVLTAGFAAASWQAMNSVEMMLMVGIGVSGAAAQLFVTAAYKYAPASQIGVFDYMQIIFVAGLALVFMGQMPDLLSIVGYVVIFGAALIMRKID